MKKEILYFVLTIGVFSNCTNSNKQINKEDLIGEWYEIIHKNKDITQGVSLKEKGLASSIGMATLKYTSWDLLNNNIILKGESIGNGITIDFTDTLQIISLQNDTLTLYRGNRAKIQYTKNTDKKNQSEMSAYSEILKKEIKLFENKNRTLRSIENNKPNAYIVFSDDSTKTELFLNDKSIILERRNRKDGTYVWNIEDDDTYSLERINNEWIITRRGNILYSSFGDDNTIKADFISSDNKNDKISAIFFNQIGVAQIIINGTNHILYQYPTASGYGYKNQFIDIRGKGKSLTVTNLNTNEKNNFIEN